MRKNSLMSLLPFLRRMPWKRANRLRPGWTNIAELLKKLIPWTTGLNLKGMPFRKEPGPSESRGSFMPGPDWLKVKNGWKTAALLPWSLWRTEILFRWDGWSINRNVFYATLELNRNSYFKGLKEVFGGTTSIPFPGHDTRPRNREFRYLSRFREPAFPRCWI